MGKHANGMDRSETAKIMSQIFHHKNNFFLIYKKKNVKPKINNERSKSRIY